MDSQTPGVRFIWALLASLAGAITALSFRPFQSLSRGEVTIALVVGMSFAMFVGPWATVMMFGKGPVDIRILGGVFYLMASGSNILIPLAVKKLSELLGQKGDA